MYQPTMIWARAFLMTACFQALFAIVVDSFLLYEFDRRLHPLSVDTDSDVGSSKRRAMGLTPTYLVILILGLLYHASLCWDTLRLQNTVQICGICFFAAAISTYSLAEVIQVQSAVNYFRTHVPGSEALLTAAESRLLVAIPIVLAITTLGLCVLAWKLSQFFAWTIYKSFSADMDVRKRYMLLELYVTLLKFDFFFFLGFAVQLLVLIGSPQGTHVGKIELYFTISAVPLAIALLLLAAWVVKHESRNGQVCILVAYFVAIAYFMYKLRQVFVSETAATYKPARGMLTVFGTLTMLLLIASVVVGLKCRKNFGTGLKEHVMQNRHSLTGGDDCGATERQRRRMTIW